jgi:HAD superfamily hydrolase (TIGR01509 family)
MEQLRLAAGLGFIFDMDGVLIESTRMHAVAWEKYLASHGIAGAGVMDEMLGRRNDEIVTALFGEHLSADEVHAHGAAKERLYRELMGPVLDENVVAGAADFIRAAHRAGIPCALATNAEPLNAEFVLTRTGLKGCFRAIVDGHKVEKPKPDPEIVLKAASSLGLCPEDCVVFEDSPGGMQAARAAGARLVALLTTLEAAPQADLAISDFNDPRLTTWLSTLLPRSASRR